MQKILIPTMQIIIGWTFIIFITIKIINYFKQKRIKEKLRNLKLQEYNKNKEKEESIKQKLQNK